MLGEILCFSVLLSRNSTVDRETERKMDVGSIQRICSVTGKRWILALTQVGFLIGSRSNTINRFSQKHLCYSLFITDRTQVSPGQSWVLAQLMTISESRALGWWVFQD